MKTRVKLIVRLDTIVWSSHQYTYYLVGGHAVKELHQRKWRLEQVSVRRLFVRITSFWNDVRKDSRTGG